MRRTRSAQIESCGNVTHRLRKTRKRCRTGAKPQNDVSRYARKTKAHADTYRKMRRTCRGPKRNLRKRNVPLAQGEKNAQGSKKNPAERKNPEEQSLTRVQGEKDAQRGCSRRAVPSIVPRKTERSAQNGPQRHRDRRAGSQRQNNLRRNGIQCSGIRRRLAGSTRRADQPATPWGRTICRCFYRI